MIPSLLHSYIKNLGEKQILISTTSDLKSLSPFRESPCPLRNDALTLVSALTTGTVSPLGEGDGYEEEGDVNGYLVSTGQVEPSVDVSGHRPSFQGTGLVTRFVHRDPQSVNHGGVGCLVTVSGECVCGAGLVHPRYVR